MADCGAGCQSNFRHAESHRQTKKSQKSKEGSRSLPTSTRLLARVGDRLEPRVTTFLAEGALSERADVHAVPFVVFPSVCPVPIRALISLGRLSRAGGTPSFVSSARNGHKTKGSSCRRPVAGSPESDFPPTFCRVQAARKNEEGFGLPS